MTTRPFKVLIDGDCPLCAKEAALLRRLDRRRGNLILEDIADPAWDPSLYAITRDEAMGSIHGITADGTVVTGMEVFRRAYAAVGLGWLLAPTRWPIIRPIADAAYRFFAKHRLALTGRKDACNGARCRVNEPA